MTSTEEQAMLNEITKFAEYILAATTKPSERFRANVVWHTAAIQASLISEQKRRRAEEAARGNRS